MAADIEKVVRDFSELLTSDDPVILQKLLIEVQIEAMRRQEYAMQDVNDKLGHIADTMDRMDWKLWELLKASNPAFSDTGSDKKE